MSLRLGGRASGLMISIMLINVPAMAQGTSPDSLTLEQAIEMTTQNHPAVQQAMQVVAASEALIEQSRSGYYPDLSGSGSYTRIDPVPSFDIPGAGSENLAPNNNYDFHLGLHQTIYDFGRRSTALELARVGRSTAVEAVESAKSGLAYQVVGAFYAILFLEQNISVIDDEINTLNQHLDITKKKVEAGTATDFEILTTEVRIANAQSQKIDMAEMLDKRKIMFRQLSGLPSDAPINLKGDFTLEPIDLNPDSLRELALSRIPEANLSRFAEKSAKIQYEMSRLGDRPSLSAEILFGYKNGYFPNLNTLKINWVGGLRLQVPIFNGFLTRSRENQAWAGVNAARYHTEDVESRVLSGVDQAISGVQASRDKVVSAEPQVKEAEQALLLARTRYDAGTATNLDLLDAETALANARLIRLRATYELVINNYALQRAVGAKIWK
jgi:outer membrane protein